MKGSEEFEYLMLSGIQHFQFCKRQWALIHIEQQWEENKKTIEGQYLHRKADQPELREKRGNKLIVRAMPVHSSNLGINGICDVVEFIKDEKGVEIYGELGRYIPRPIEYKRGKPKKNDADVLQLVAQAICLEEMLLCDVNTGYLYYNEIKHRVEVAITPKIKDKVKSITEEMHHYYFKRHTPKVKTGKHCNSCSLKNICLPGLMKNRSVKSYIESRLIE